MSKYIFCDEHNGVEIYFDSFPDENTRKTLRENGWRWSKAKLCWYIKKSPDAIRLAEQLCNQNNTSNKVAKEKADIIVNPVNIINNNNSQRCCYANTVEDFLQIDESSWINLMQNNFAKQFNLPLDTTQIKVWKDCFNVLQKELKLFNNKHKNFGIVFEYALPYESGRRPDVVLVSSEFVIILEFKKKNFLFSSDVDQASAYQRDIEEYHYESRTRNVATLLVETEMQNTYYEDGIISICSGDMLHVALDDFVPIEATACDINKWINSKYEPLPTIVQAAKMFVKNEELPNIRRVNSTCIPQAIECLNEISKYAQESKEHVVAFVTGVPGAGKTFLGLQYVYDICNDYNNVNSVYLSGNGPLVSVLTDALHSSVFVKDLHKVVIQYLSNGAPDFHNNIIVFDEGQRAWDKKQMNEKRNTTKSEPDVIMELCSKRLDWCVLLVLVGEGQEIHNGENSGIAQWETAIKNSSIKWDVLCPYKLDNVFDSCNRLNIQNRDALNLSQSLRTHLASDVSAFANSLISGNIEKAKMLSVIIKKQGFPIYVTRDLELAKRYLRERYKDEPTKRYGMIASSKGSVLRKYGMDNSFYGALGSYSVGKWFNAEANDPKSCCALEVCATEFSCQGLEIDMPLIGWDSDMIWNGNSWNKYKASEPDDSDANVYRKNSYRVLLTRGRDGMIVFVPDILKMDSVYGILSDVGFEELISNEKE